MGILKGPYWYSWYTGTVRTAPPQSLFDMIWVILKTPFGTAGTLVQLVQLHHKVYLMSFGYFERPLLVQPVHTGTVSTAPPQSLFDIILVF